MSVDWLCPGVTAAPPCRFAAHCTFLVYWHLVWKLFAFCLPQLRSAAEAVERKKLVICCCRNGDRKQCSRWRRNRAGPGVRGGPALHQPGLHRRGCLRDGRVSNKCVTLRRNPRSPDAATAATIGANLLLRASAGSNGPIRFQCAPHPQAHRHSKSKKSCPILASARASGVACLHWTNFVFVFAYCRRVCFA